VSLTSLIANFFNGIDPIRNSTNASLRLFGVGLRADGHVLASGHRHGASHKSRDTRDQDIVLRRSRRGNADDQACGRDDAIGGPEHRGSQPPDAVAGEDGSPDIPPVSSDPPEQNKNDNDDQDGAEDTDTTVTVPVPVAAESATEATEQENDEDDNEDGSERHDFCPFAGPN
jgi:hypothetical protein